MVSAERRLGNAVAVDQRQRVAVAREHACARLPVIDDARQIDRAVARVRARARSASVGHFGADRDVQADRARAAQPAGAGNVHA